MRAPAELAPSQISCRWRSLHQGTPVESAWHNRRGMVKVTLGGEVSEQTVVQFRRIALEVAGLIEPGGTHLQNSSLGIAAQGKHEPS